MLPTVRLRSRAWRLDVSPFTVTTEDGVELHGSGVGGEGPALVFCHGFLGWHRKTKFVAFVEHLARRFRVYAFDFRGHGSSGGASTYGDLEALDVDAVVRHAVAEAGRPVVTVGVSMGGVSVVRQAALRGGVDAVVAISTPARWDGHRSRHVLRMARFGGTRAGTRMARAIGVRLGDWRPWPESPEDVVDRIAPTPLILVHGRDDHYFDEEEAWRLYRRAGEPKRLLLASRFGHAEDGLTGELADMLSDRLHAILA